MIACGIEGGAAVVGRQGMGTRAFHRGDGADGKVTVEHDHGEHRSDCATGLFSHGDEALRDIAGASVADVDEEAPGRGENGDA